MWETTVSSAAGQTSNRCSQSQVWIMGMDYVPLWRHQMETFSALLTLCAGNLPVAGEFSSQRSVTRSFDVFFDLHLNKRLSKQSRCRWFQTPPYLLWRHCNGTIQDHQTVYGRKSIFTSMVSSGSYQYHLIRTNIFTPCIARNYHHLIRRHQHT